LLFAFCSCPGLAPHLSFHFLSLARDSPSHLNGVFKCFYFPQFAALAYRQYGVKMVDMVDPHDERFIPKIIQTFTNSVGTAIPYTVVAYAAFCLFSHSYNTMQHKYHGDASWHAHAHTHTDKEKQTSSLCILVQSRMYIKRIPHISASNSCLPRARALVMSVFPLQFSFLQPWGGDFAPGHSEQVWTTCEQFF
jgi:hypothetical protein